MKTLELKDRIAVKVETNRFAPFAYKGQFVLYAKNMPINDGDFVYVCLRKGRGKYEWEFRQAMLLPKGRKNERVFSAIGTLDKSKPVIGKIGSRNIPLGYRVTEVITYYK